MRIEISIKPKDVKAEAKRRLDDIDWRVERAIDDGDVEEEKRLRQLRVAIRAESNAMEKMPTIPTDYASDERWSKLADATAEVLGKEK